MNSLPLCLVPRNRFHMTRDNVVVEIVYVLASMCVKYTFMGTMQVSCGEISDSSELINQEFAFRIFKSNCQKELTICRHCQS